MVHRKRHPIKEIEHALRYAEKHGWSCVELSGHAWGKILCPFNDTACRCGVFCQKSIWSTPKVPEDIARQIRRAVDGCVLHGQAPPTDDDSTDADKSSVNQPKLGGKDRDTI